jgi:ubiquinone/menaquinone biosynthesis C-methylase UbiE
MTRFEGFVPTPTEVATGKLALANIQKGDVVFDLGCGDGRVLIQCAREYSARCVGVEFDGPLVDDARSKVDAENLSALIEIRHESFEETDLSDADVVLLYLNRGTLGFLSQKLEDELKPGTRVITHDFDLPGWEGEEKTSVDTGTGQSVELFLYVKKY